MEAGDRWGIDRKGPGYGRPLWVPSRWSFKDSLFDWRTEFRKTALARDFAARISHKVGEPLFLECTRKELKTKAERLKQIEKDVSSLIPGRIPQSPTKLVILDGAVDPEAIDVVRRFYAGQILVTSQYRKVIGDASAAVLELDSLSENDSETILRIHLGARRFQAHREELLKLARSWDFSAGAVAELGRVLSRRYGPTQRLIRDASLVDLVPRCCERLDWAFDSMSKEHRKLLEAMAVCSGDWFWYPLASKISGLDASRSCHLRDELVNASLVRVSDQDREYFRLSGIVRAYLLHSMDILSWKERHAIELVSVLRNADSQFEDKRECAWEVASALDWLSSVGRTDQLLDMAAAAIEGTRQLRPTEEQKLLSVKEQIGTGLIGEAWRIEKTLARFCSNKALVAQAWGPDLIADQEPTLTHQNSLREALMSLDEASEFCRKADDLGGLRENYALQGDLYLASGDLSRAEGAWKDQVTVSEKMEDGRGQALGYGNLAAIALLNGQPGEAVKLFRLREAALGAVDGTQLDDLPSSFGDLSLVFYALTSNKPDSDDCRESGLRGDAASTADVGPVPAPDQLRLTLPERQLRKQVQEIRFAPGNLNFGEFRDRLLSDTHFVRRSIDDIKEKQSWDDIQASFRESTDRLILDRSREMSPLRERLLQKEQLFTDRGDDEALGRLMEMLSSVLRSEAEDLWAKGKYAGARAKFQEALRRLVQQEAIWHRTGSRIELLVTYENQEYLLSRMAEREKEAGSQFVISLEGKMDTPRRLDHVTAQRLRMGALTSFQVGLAYSLWNWGILSQMLGNLSRASALLRRAVKGFSLLGLLSESLTAQRCLDEIHPSINASSADSLESRIGGSRLPAPPQ